VPAPGEGRVDNTNLIAASEEGTRRFIGRLEQLDAWPVRPSPMVPSRLLPHTDDVRYPLRSETACAGEQE
jgi:hypothetical protein